MVSFFDWNGKIFVASEVGLSSCLVGKLPSKRDESYELFWNLLLLPLILRVQHKNNGLLNKHPIRDVRFTFQQAYVTIYCQNLLQIISNRCTYQPLKLHNNVISHITCGHAPKTIDSHPCTQCNKKSWTGLPSDDEQKLSLAYTGI